LHAAQQQLAADRRRFEEEQKQLELTRSPLERAEAGAYRTPTSTVAPTSVAQTWVNTLGMTFVLIPAGEFLLGSEYGSTNEKPVHRVRISRPFYLGQYVVTQGQWQAVMGGNPSSSKGDPNLPVESVSWGDVQEFIRRLHAREGLTPAGGRLRLGRLFGSWHPRKEHLSYRRPTEAEWEYAARAGSAMASRISI
jgi:formylglycine-generating enzyme required for sulfatase activity